jgi:hypothetical integral membrane protein (TIGR02206 family)
LSAEGLQFKPFTPLHYLCLFTCAVGWFALVRRAIAVRGTPLEHRFRRRLAFATIGFNALWMLYRFTPAYYDIDASLPLHACDFAWMFGASAILHDSTTRGGERLDRAFAYFFGIGLAPLGAITPVLTDGPDDVDFYAFWLRHFLIPACALVDLCAFHFRATRRATVRVTALTLLMLVPITILNVKLGTSYFFTGKETPQNPTPLDALPAWPWRLVVIVAIGVAWFALLGFLARRRANPLP